MQVSKIDASIYIGTNRCCEYHFDEKLLKKGIDYDVSLEAEKLDMPSGVEGFLWLPVKDMRAPLQSQPHVGVRMIEECVKQGKKVFVHCKNGHGRAPTLVAAYYIATKEITVNTALELVKKKRPSAHPNNMQMKALKEFTKSLG